jgi:flagellin-like protein
LCEESGISPVIATILLIGVTVAAAAVIAVYVAGLYVPFIRAPLAGDVDASIFDYDDDAAKENYKNANILMLVHITSGEMRSIGDPGYGGTTVTVLNEVTGFTASVKFDNTDDWGETMKKSVVIDNYFDSDNGAVVEVSMSPSATGELGVGSIITIRIYPEGCEEARDPDHADDRMAWDQKWTEGEPWTITITGRDSLTVDVYRLYGASWAA